MADTELLKNASDFETQFNSWFNSAMKPLIEDSRARYRILTVYKFAVLSRPRAAYALSEFNPKGRAAP